MQLEQALYDRQPERSEAHRPIIRIEARTILSIFSIFSILYTERLAEAGIEPALGGRGDSYDNALAETINGLYKAELMHRRFAAYDAARCQSGHR